MDSSSNPHIGTEPIWDSSNYLKSIQVLKSCHLSPHSPLCCFSLPPKKLQVICLSKHNTLPLLSKQGKHNNYQRGPNSRLSLSKNPILISPNKEGLDMENGPPPLPLHIPHIGCILFFPPYFLSLPISFPLSKHSLKHNRSFTTKMRRGLIRGIYICQT